MGKTTRSWTVTKAEARFSEVIDRALKLLVATLEKRKFAATSEPRPSARHTTGQRHVPADVKRTVWARDGGQCTFVGKTGQFLTCSGDQSVKGWNVDNGQATRTLGGGTDFLYAVAASPDGQVVAAGGEEGVVRVYAGDGKLVRTLAP